MATDATGTKKPSKTKMVQEAIQAGKRKPLPIQAWILEKYGEEVKTQHISTIKSNIRKGAGKKPGRKPGPKPRSESNGEAMPKKNKSSKEEQLTVDEIRMVRNLVDRLGRAQFNSVLDLLA